MMLWNRYDSCWSFILGWQASALKIPIKNFLEDQLFKPELVRKNLRPKIKLGEGTEIEVLSADFGRQLQVLMVDLPSGYQAGNNTHTI
ncbi:MAG: hypothetical protein ACI8WT_001133 [Clostridium sp.]|jgi:hypothetical protein